MMIVHIRDWYGVVDKFEVVETRKAPEGFGGKISVIFINSRGDKEKAVVNSDHVQVKRMPDLEYEFEPMGFGKFQVRLCGMFVCYSTHTNKHSIDGFLRNEGYKSRQEYFDACLEDIDDVN